jgi:hypothetical protein
MLDTKGRFWLDRPRRPLYLVSLETMRTMYRSGSPRSLYLVAAETAATASSRDSWRTVAGWAWLIYLTAFTALAAWALLG